MGLVSGGAAPGDAEPSRVRGVAAALLLAALLAAPGLAAAQLSVFGGGAAAVPVADFGEVGELGYQVILGGTMELGPAGVSVSATGFFGSNGHVIEGDRSDLYGATVLAGYALAEPLEVALTAWAGLGGTVHSRKSDTFPGLDASKRGITASGGMTALRPAGRVGVFAFAFYTRGFGDLGASSYPTELVTLGVGVAIPLELE